MNRETGYGERQYSQSLRVLETVVWVVAATAAIVGVAVVLGLAMQGDLTMAKVILFLVGFVLFGVSSFLLRPKPPKKDAEDRFSVEGYDETRFEKVVQQVPPLDKEPIPIDQRVNRNVKLFLTSLLVLAVSFLMEAVGGVGA
jgi:hypothetical protein